MNEGGGGENFRGPGDHPMLMSATSHRSLASYGFRIECLFSCT